MDDDLVWLLGLWRWLRTSLALVLSFLFAVVLVVGLVIGEVRLADALALGALAFAGIAFVIVHVKRIYPRVFPSGPGSKQRQLDT